MSQSYRCERAGPEHAQQLLALFEAAGTGCFCNYWHFEGDKNAWLERCYINTDQNRAALVERLSGPELCGVVALPSSARSAAPLSGWLKLARASAVPRLYDQRVYRNLPCFQAAPGERENVYAVGCCYVAEAERGRGVARALLNAAIEAVRVAGGSALEAFPRGAPRAGGRRDGRGDGDHDAVDSSEGPAEPLRPDELWLGPEPLFLRAGFTRVSDFRPYPVLRLHLR
jgi:GNAT superfamily N-acetyltransferase